MSKAIHVTVEGTEYPACNVTAVVFSNSAAATFTLLDLATNEPIVTLRVGSSSQLSVPVAWPNAVSCPKGWRAEALTGGEAFIYVY